jgi:hypothetical protein
MNTHSTKHSAFTLVEALVLIAIIFILASLIPWTPDHGKVKAYRIVCVNNLKQVGLAHRIWANDHEGQFSFASTNMDSSLAWVNSPEVFRHFQIMSNELMTPKILVCRADTQRSRATNFNEFSNTNLSYFVGLDAREDAPQSLLSGDRNITGGTLSNGFLRVLFPNTAVEWTKEIHQDAGNIGLGDGSVQQVTTAKLRQQLALQTNAFIRLAVP